MRCFILVRSSMIVLVKAVQRSHLMLAVIDEFNRIEHTLLV
jgi:hypothetical protein